MIIEHADTPRFKKIRSEFNALLFGAMSVAPSNTVIIDQGDYEDEVQEFLRENSTPPPAEPTAATDIDKTPTSPAEPSVSADPDKTPLPPRLGHHVATSIVLQDTHTVSTSSQTISITTHPSEPEAEIDPPVIQPKKSRPVAKKVANTNDVNASDATDTTPAANTRRTRASNHKDSLPAARNSGRKNKKNA